MTEKIIQRGAEALIILDNNKIIKRRVKKSYRLQVLDERLRRQRTRAESKLLEKASKIIPVPKAIKTDESKKEIEMDFLEGEKLSEHLNDFPLIKQKNICKIIGQNIAKLHDAEIIHGDLTTSNMIYVEDSEKKIIGIRKRGDKNDGVVNLKVSSRGGGRNKFSVYFIDFGLGFISQKAEDKAVDLHLLKQALEAKHFKSWEKLFSEAIKGYSISKNHKVVLKQLEKVEKRGRYKDQY